MKSDGVSDSHVLLMQYSHHHLEADYCIIISLQFEYWQNCRCVDGMLCTVDKVETGFVFCHLLCPGRLI